MCRRGCTKVDGLDRYRQGAEKHNVPFRRRGSTVERRMHGADSRTLATDVQRS